MPHLASPSTPRLIAAVLLLSPAAASAQSSWVFAPGAYTHNPVTGARTTQYAPDPWVEPLDDPRQTVSRYSRTTSNRRGADGSNDQIIEVQSFGNTRGGFDAQRERGFDASLQTLRALEPFRRNPFLFFGGLQGFGYGFPGLPAAAPYGQPAPHGAAPPYGYAVPAPQAPAQPAVPPPAQSQPAPQAAVPAPAVGQPGTAYPYQPQTGVVAPVAPFAPYWGGYGWPGFGGPGFGGPGYGSGYGPGFGQYPQGR